MRLRITARRRVRQGGRENLILARAGTGRRRLDAETATSAGSSMGFAGTPSPRSPPARITPAAMSSLAANIAVGRRGQIEQFVSPAHP